MTDEELIRRLAIGYDLSCTFYCKNIEYVPMFGMDCTLHYEEGGCGRENGYCHFELDREKLEEDLKKEW